MDNSTRKLLTILERSLRYSLNSLQVSLIRLNMIIQMAF